MSRLPQLIAFDLDYTLWDLWIDTHVTAPLRRDNDTINQVLDRYDQDIRFYRDVPQILHRLRDAGVEVAACSRTTAPTLANQALRLLLVRPTNEGEEPIPAVEFFDQLEIYPGSKISHFKQLHEKTGIPYTEMLFFDDEHRNAEVEKLGVTFHLVPEGLHASAFEEGLLTWRQRNGATS
ncbi:magnesium-dependent phosphatase-1 [Pluteus cervinus]|uniref:Magnesium-dependent phosphatase-1 n=1 Tax=Pluteus cervinus TaxID=181527 RepID=A0ACD3B2K6_9AGAR|nr:magnesium-dependent phosphatase-1 [Pluteus cervinus]